MSDVKYTSWRKSSFSANSGNCVEVSSGEHTVAVRDSHQGGHGPILEFTAGTWREFITQAKKGGLDIAS